MNGCATTDGSGTVNGDVKHHLALYTGGRHGAWSTCSCGWESGVHRTSVAAHLAFGRHLLAVSR